MQPESDTVLEKGLLSNIRPIKETALLTDNLSAFLKAIKPEFIYLPSKPEPTKLRKTAYLDGIRGVASVIVYILHHELWAHGWLKGDVKLENYFGWNGEYYLLSLPVLRNIFVGGHFAVSTFFVLSGYVLSAKPLSLIMAGDYAGLSDNVASALFRRWLRLYLPIIQVTLILISFYHITGVIGTVKLERTFLKELWKWYAEGKNWTYVFTTGGEPWFTFHPHTWSIPVEMKGSIAIYTSLMAFSRCSIRGRLTGEIGLMMYFMYIADGAHFAMFIAGMFLCDLDTLAAHNKLPSWFTDLAQYRNNLAIGAFCVSIFLGGVPAQSADFQQFKQQTFIWPWLAVLKPQAVFDFKWFYLFWAAFLFVACVPHLPWLRKFFETKYNQYLAKISFAFYLVHGPVLWTLGNRMYAAVGYHGEEHALMMPRWVNAFPIPRIGPFGFETNFLACQMILLPLTLWLAELCTKFIDDPSIKFTQWLYKQFKGQGEAPSFARREQK